MPPIRITICRSESDTSGIYLYVYMAINTKTNRKKTYSFSEGGSLLDQENVAFLRSIHP